MSADSKPKQVLHSMGDLKKVKLTPLPDLTTGVELSLSPEAAEAEAEKIREEARRIREWVLVNLSQWKKWRGQSREARELNGNAMQQFHRDLRRLLDRGLPAHRRAGKLAVLLCEFSQPLETKQEVLDLLERLEGEGQIEKNPEGFLRAYGESFGLSPYSLLEDFNPQEEGGTDLAEWVKEVHRALTNLVSQIWQKEKEIRDQRVEKHRTGENISLQELLDGQSGVCIVDVPPEQQDGKVLRGGGTLVIESQEIDGDKKIIKPLAASGAIASAIEEAVRLEIHLLPHSLEWETPPFIRGLPKEQGEKVRLLWYLLQRAIEAAKKAKQLQEERERIEALKDEFAKRADVSPEDFFLKNEPGICLVESQRVWEDKTGKERRFNCLFLLVERKRKGQNTTIQIKEIPGPPEHPEPLEDFFGECMSEYPEGERFEGCPQPLKAVLQGVYGQVQRSASSDTDEQ